MYKKYYYHSKNNNISTVANIKHKYGNHSTFNFEIYDIEVELLLKALECFNFNINNCWIRNVDNEQMKLRNDIIFYLYHRLLDVYSNEYDIDTRIKISKNINFDIA